MPETKDMNQAMQFDKIQIGLASPEKIREWSYGEVKKPETINYRTLKPEKDGLFCEKIFGPTKDWECHCGKYKKIRYKGVVCDRCGVEITKSSVRRERMGHIELAAPVSHIWYFKGIPSRMGYLLELSPRLLERVLYFASYIVMDPKETGLAKKQVLTESEYEEACETYGKDAFEVGMGAEAIRKLLEEFSEEIERPVKEIVTDEETGEQKEVVKTVVDEETGEVKEVMETVTRLDLEAESLMKDLETASGAKRANELKRLDVVQAFRESGNKPEWMIMTVIPVIPPDLRPMVQLDGGRFATSDLNDLYRRIINRNNRLRRLLDLGAPEIIVRNEKRMLQEAVDALIDNGRRGRPVTGPGNRALKSLSDMLKGKGGRFRQNLLGKRVDYSGRSVICVEPKLKMYQCGLPKEMAIELFKPFVMKELVANGTAHNIKNAKKMVERLEPQVWDVLEDVIKEHPVMLNRAPTLHRLGIQAFEPILVEGRAIKLHPLVCTAFNADFDGDQMAVHLPLTAEAQAECRFMLLSPNNLLKPSDGGLVAVPSQDMILGVYYLTMRKLADYKSNPQMVAQVVSDHVYNDLTELYRLTTPKSADEGAELGLYDLIWFEDVTDGNRRILTHPIDVLSGLEEVDGVKVQPGRHYGSENLALLAYENKEITLHQDIYVYRTAKMEDGTEVKGFVKMTVGLIIFNENIPQDLGFVDRTKPENVLLPEVEFHVGKKQIKKILEKVINTHGTTTTAEVLDNIKAMGYKYSTQAAMTVSISDMTVPASKQEILDDAQATVDKITRNYRRGIIKNEERYKEVVETWTAADKELTKRLLDGLDKYNNIFMMADSGARGSNSQIKQLAGMKGMVADTSGAAIEMPIKSNFREGLDVLEYFMSAHGARKGMSDTALRTADSGYLTRRLVDVSQHIIVREADCMANRDGELPGMVVKAFMDGKEELESLRERITGRVACETICDKDGNVLVKRNHMITPKRADAILSKGVDADGNPIEAVKIRTALTCRTHLGVCAKCYGMNLATGQAVQVGEAVGIIAAQSIGEPGTQLTMRTFHTGGVAGGDITQGLPRVEEIFEARKPKGLAMLTDIAGIATIKDDKKKREIIITNPETGDTKIYPIPYGSRIKDIDGKFLEAGDELTEGSVNPHDILKIKDVRAVQEYMLREVQKPYRSQGVDINDKHIEIIVRQCLQKVRVEEAGDSTLIPGNIVDALDFLEMNEQLEKEGKTPAKGSQELLGITKASLATNSFLSAASFQETTRVLTEAAIKGKTDPLVGMKENVIIGKLIPAGTGMKRYRAVKLDTDVNEDEELEGFDDMEFDTADYSEKPIIMNTVTSDDLFTDEEAAEEEAEEDAMDAEEAETADTTEE